MADTTSVKQIYELRTEIERLQSQKDTLLKELDQTEENLETSQKLYQRYLPLIIDLLTEGRSGFPPVLKELSTAFKKGSSIAKIEYLFFKLHETMLKEERTAAKTGGPSLLARLFSSSNRRLLEEFKQGYLEIINTLKSTLENRHMETLTALSKRILKAKDPRAMGHVRDDLFDLLQTHIAGLGDDREKLTQFVQDIVQRIVGMEELIGKSFDYAHEVLEPGEGFDNLLTGEIERLRTDIDVAETLDGLKTQVSGTLLTIEDALKKKVAKERMIKEVAEKNRYTFQTGFARFKKELDEATRHSRELEKKLNLDPLTGAFNRRAYNKRIEDEMDRYIRYGAIFSLLVIDADKFKNVNDTYGHAIGDKCLQEIIKRTSSHLRKSDMLARYGGEEFVVVMPETDGNGAREVAEKIRQTIAKIEFIYKEDAVKLTVSIGATQVKEGDAVPQDVFDRADVAVYQAKEGGRNRVVLN
ncbi:MAG: GGDEF domain-containing protein [Desulfobacteraceae bacterium]|nr:GGDEF domain-containing protein [Desulfobacteraceae bacterium]